jgi:hypothetical protein
MADNNNKVNKAFIEGKMEKYGVTRKTIYSSLSILACIALIVVLSLTQAYFDPEKLKNIDYWVSLAIQIAICIFGMIAGKQAGDDISRNKKGGRYRVSLGSYTEVIKNIKDLGLYSYIGDWLENYRLRKLDDKIRMVLGDNGIRQPEVVDLDFSDLPNLKRAGWQKSWENTPYKLKYWKPKEERSFTNFVEYTDHQIAVIRAVKEGKVKVSRLPSTFFVNAFSESERDEWESSARAGKKKGLYLGMNYTYKVVSMAIFSILLTGLEVLTQDSGDAAATARMWLTMISRISTLLMSYVWGTFIGFNMVKIDNEYLDFKVSTMTLMTEEYKNGTYKKMSVEEMADAAYEKRQRQSRDLAIIEGEGVREVKKDG